MRIALVVLCAAVYLQFSPGRILFPDDEIVFQTTRSLYERGDLVVEGIPKRTGELEGRPDGTFGWAPGTDGRRYGFFGHALSVVALPLYGVGKWASTAAPEAWRHAIRSDTYFLHRRSREADWTRMFVSFANALVTAAAAWLVAEWIVALGYRAPIGIGVALAYALATSAWAYAGTFLSEPLSSLLLVLGALGVTRFVRGLHGAWLYLATLAVAAAVHTHVLNVVAIPAYVLWVVLALRRQGPLARHTSTLAVAATLGALALAALGASHYARFGSAWETGRYDHYSHFVLPADGLVAMLVGPGRSLLLYSPALLVALPGVRVFARRHRDVAIFLAILLATRWLFVAARSDWWGGWAIGPRYLLPIVPLALAPLAEVLQRATAGGVRARLGVGVALLTAAALSMHLASHSIFEHMVKVSNVESSMRYIDVSHWVPSASPIVGFFALPPDSLSMGAWRLAQHGHPGMFIAFATILTVGVLAAAVLTRCMVRAAR